MFARLVKQKMDETRLGVRDLARISGVDPSFLSKILSGKRSPPAEDKKIAAIARALKIDADRLMLAAGRAPAWIAQRLSEPGVLETFKRVGAHQAYQPPRAASPVRQPAARPYPTPPPQRRVRARASSELPSDLL